MQKTDLFVGQSQQGADEGGFCSWEKFSWVPALQYLQYSLPDCSKAWGDDVFSLLLSLSLVLDCTHAYVHLLLGHEVQLLYVQKHQSRLSGDYLFPHVHWLFHVANNATRCPVCSNAHRRHFLCFSSRLPVWKKQSQSCCLTEAMSSYRGHLCSYWTTGFGCKFFPIHHFNAVNSTSVDSL